MKINKLIENFHGFIIVSWPNLQAVLEMLDWDENPYFLDNWMQANWEFLVEMQAIENGMLAPYGFAASYDCRAKKTNETETYRITCRSNVELKANYYFLGFVSETGGNYKIEPPFDFIAVEEIVTGARFCIAFENMDFFVEKIS